MKTERWNDDDDDDDGLITKTSLEQARCAKLVRASFELNLGQEGSPPPRLWAEDHARWLVRCVGSGLNASYESLDASQPWLMYWSCNALDLLGRALPSQITQAAAAQAALRTWQSAQKGGFGGGYLQEPHLAPTYAATRVAAITGALGAVDAAALGRFLQSVKQPDGSFASHTDGEVDMRGVYCALASADIMGILTPRLASGAADWIAACQTYEGGLAGAPGCEAHGGYAFCGLAALALLGRLDAIDTPRMLRWLVRRQMAHEGGFQGRTNKLVDSCYSFWLGASLAILGKAELLDVRALERYVLCAAQDERGGLRDKPGKGRDLYHSCYALSGLSIAQHADPEALMDRTVLLKEIDPVHAISKEKLQLAKKH
jgi:protein farnesyltransferase subunit beta